MAGAGGLGAACPAVLAPRTFSRIFADFPLPFEVAQTAAFSACRNDECHSMMLFASSGDRASVSAKAPLIANDFSEQVQVNVLAATGEAHAPKASYVLLTWYLVPDASDYTRTDTYTLTVDQAGVRTELIHPPVTYTKTMSCMASVPPPQPSAPPGAKRASISGSSSRSRKRRTRAPTLNAPTRRRSVCFPEVLTLHADLPSRTESTKQKCDAVGGRLVTPCAAPSNAMRAPKDVQDVTTPLLHLVRAARAFRPRVDEACALAELRQGTHEAGAAGSAR